MAKADLTAQRLRELLHYDPDTGIFRWNRSSKEGRIRDDFRAGSMHAMGYWQINVDRSPKLAHRLAWLYMTGAWPKAQIDHINGTRSDNRFANLREATNAENAQNKRRAKRDNIASGLLGVIRQKNGRWTAHITANGKTHCLGTYDDAEQAHAQYIAAKRRLHPFGSL